MEKNRICKICNRRFANGKAMGGHMRSHLAKLPLPPKPIPSEQAEPPSSKSLSPSSSAASLNYPPTKNPMQSHRSVNHRLPLMSKTNLAAFLDGDSETESPKNTTQRRSKRRRKSLEKVAESIVKVSESTEQVSSISCIFNEEEVAMCLLMLSRDKRWTKKVVDEYMEDEAEDHSEEEDEPSGVIRLRSKTNGRHTCETCKRVFRSYQALGGHRSSHTRIKTSVEDEDEDRSRSSNGGVVGNEPRIFKCPYCDKVFGSGQALGGHKKVHLSYLGNDKISIKSADNLLDLNLPAPEDDGEVSQAEVSTFSNPKAYQMRK